MSSMNDNNPNTSAWGIKGLIAALVIAGAFLGFLFMALGNEPDYMPSQQKKIVEQERLAEQKATEEKQAEKTPAEPVAEEKK